MPKKIVPVITGNSNLDQGLASFPELNNKDALDVALALQQIVRGQSSILDQLNENSKNSAFLSEELAKIRARMAEYDKVAEAYNNNQENFIEKVMSKAEKKKVTGAKKDKLVAKASVDLTKEIQQHRAAIVSDNLSFEQELARMPIVRVTSPGKLETVIEGGQNVPKLYPEEIRIKHKRWILPPGVPTEVPAIVAEVLEQRRRTEAESAERGEAMKKNLSSEELTTRMQQINKKYNSNGGTPLQGE